MAKMYKMMGQPSSSCDTLLTDWTMAPLEIPFYFFAPKIRLLKQQNESSIEAWALTTTLGKDTVIFLEVSKVNIKATEW